MDGQEVCQALRITKRTLQSYRDKGLLGCSTVGGKYYYREKDVTEFLQARTAKKEI
ncbi:helix-turn-helix domain-containing protein [Alistipes onderdonkii]|uniref:helix-turn-helix domain-containing protein n=1 Tax=Alistipes onderdonkii TaxID=328813 RepID=UPI0009FC2EF1|nr:helix-turn-helix domain-containing protein [Alistipes onderdonkii]UWN63602.1 helix-turn-helix domain-containing protein [Alistipes onderdonkii]